MLFEWSYSVPDGRSCHVNCSRRLQDPDGWSPQEMDSWIAMKVWICSKMRRWPRLITHWGIWYETSELWSPTSSSLMLWCNSSIWEVCNLKQWRKNRAKRFHQYVLNLVKSPLPHKNRDPTENTQHILKTSLQRGNICPGILVTVDQVQKGNMICNN